MRVSGEPLLDRGDRLLILAEGEARIGEKLEQDFRIMRVQPHRRIKRREGAGWIAGEYLDMGHHHEEVDGVGRKGEAPLRLCPRPVQLPAPQASHAQRDVTVGLFLGHRHRLLRELQPNPQRVFRIVAPGVDVIEHMGEGDEGVGRGISRIDGGGGSRHAARRDISRSGMRRRPLPATQEEFVGLDIDRARPGQPILVANRELQLECRHDLLREFVLNRENVGEVAIEPAGPDMSAAARIDQLRGDSHPVPHLAHAALKHVADAKGLGHVRHGDRCLLVDERRVAGDHVQLGQPREVRNDVLADAIGEILLFGIAAHVVERKHGDGGFVGNGRRRRFFRHRGLRLNRDANLQRIHSDRIGDVLELHCAAIIDRQIEPCLDLPVGLVGETDTARFAYAFQPGGDVDAIAHQIAITLLDDIPQMNADAKFDAALRGQPGIAFDHAALHFDGAAHGVDHAAELNETTVTGSLDDAPVMRVDGGIDQIAP